MLAAWVLAVVACLLTAAGRRAHAYLAFAGPVIATLIVVSQVLGVLEAGASATNQVYNEWPMLLAHILLIFLASAGFAVSAFASLMLLYQQHLMRRKSKRLLDTNMPAVSTLALVARRAALAGAVLFLAGLLVGGTHFAALYSVMAAVGCEGSLMYLIPRIVLSLVVLALYVVYLVLSFLLPHVAGSRARAMLSVCGLALTIVLVVVSAG